MILFKEEHKDLILKGIKTQTRRFGDKRWNVGSIHQCKLKMFGGESFADMLITGVRKERLKDMSVEDAIKEGYYCRGEYFDAFKSVYGKLDLRRSVWVVDFKLVS